MKFEWNGRKGATNLKKHGISFEEAETVFGDPFARTVPDEAHAAEELRFATLGMSEKGRLLIVIHAESVAPRIISARLPTRRERIFYEENAK
ncbi:MAG: BrnT family toxin [Pyrinomonadaceae bacterium]